MGELVLSSDCAEQTISEISRDIQKNTDNAQSFYRTTAPLKSPTAGELGVFDIALTHLDVGMVVAWRSN